MCSRSQTTVFSHLLLFFFFFYLKTPLKNEKHLKHFQDKNLESKHTYSVQCQKISSVAQSCQSATPWTTARQASLSEDKDVLIVALCDLDIFNIVWIHKMEIMAAACSRSPKSVRIIDHILKYYVHSRHKF